MLAPPDASDVQERIDNIEAYYQELRRATGDRQARLEAAVPVAARFAETRQQLHELVPTLEAALRSHRFSKPEAEAEVEQLESRLAEMEPLIQSLRQTGEELQNALPEEAADRLNDALDKDLNRYDQLAEEISRRAQKFGSTRQRAKSIADSLDRWQKWIDDEMDILAAEPPLTSDVEGLRQELAKARAMRDVLGENRVSIQDALQEARKLLRESPSRSVAGSPIRERADNVKATLAALETATNARLTKLESALPLASEFVSTAAALEKWLNEAERGMFETNLLKLGVEQLRDMTDENKVSAEASNCKEGSLVFSHTASTPHSNAFLLPSSALIGW